MNAHEDLFHIVACCPNCMTAFNAPPGNCTSRAWVTCPDCRTPFWGLVLPRSPETTFGGKLAYLPAEYDFVVRIRPDGVRFSQRDIEIIAAALEQAPNHHYACTSVKAWLATSTLIRNPQIEDQR